MKRNMILLTCLILLTVLVGTTKPTLAQDSVLEDDPRCIAPGLCINAGGPLDRLRIDQEELRYDAETVKVWENVQFFLNICLLCYIMYFTCLLCLALCVFHKFLNFNLCI